VSGLFVVASRVRAIAIVVQKLRMLAASVLVMPSSDTVKVVDRP
jgi:hypothetical protein